MKKLTIFILAFIGVIGLVGCSISQIDNVKNQLVVCSFNGENEQFSISNGVIVFGENEEIFYGGDLKVIQEESFMNVASFSTTYYTIIDGEKRIILSDAVTDMSGGSINVNGELGKISGNDFLIENINELKNNLWFELDTTNINGQTSKYQLQLTLTTVTNNSNK